ncbi:PilN domain-containing protein [Actinoplanes sp. TRM 88003]|uniref:PilN domain-containing protein n=1 Tax=Paractinoplanes aksuensis TaxID=2939490 RepID=A0ABT1DQ10_9ACTN|nr:PilN domain-containing protein [Actinoplanes aksuensis]MCO8272926.1 PilN domain-containing protein [Actinoplanes aksuensis]
MTTTQTALMPVDPAVSPAQAARILTIRANLLPEEIRAGRSARRTRFALIGAVVAVIAGLGGWYAYAVHQVDTAHDNLTMATDQVRRVQNEKKKYSGVTATINDVKTVQNDLKSLLATDLPWATTMDRLRSDAKATDVVIDGLSGTMADGAATTPATGATSAAVATFSITGTAPDKKHVAEYLDRLATMPGFTDPYLVTTAQEDTTKVTYSLTVKVTSAALCGRFTTACKTGGN